MSRPHHAMIANKHLCSSRTLGLKLGHGSQISRYGSAKSERGIACTCYMTHLATDVSRSVATLNSIGVSFSVPEESCEAGISVSPPTTALPSEWYAWVAGLIDKV